MSLPWACLQLRRGRGGQALGPGSPEQEEGAEPAPPHPHDDPATPPGDPLLPPPQESPGHQLLLLVSRAHAHTHTRSSSCSFEAAATHFIPSLDPRGCFVTGTQRRAAASGGSTSTSAATWTGNGSTSPAVTTPTTAQGPVLTWGARTRRTARYECEYAVVCETLRLRFGLFFVLRDFPPGTERRK